MYLFFRILFIFRGRGREGEREGEKHQCVFASHVELTGTWPATQARALTGNWTSDPLVLSPRSIHWATPARAIDFFSDLGYRLGWHTAFSCHVSLAPFNLELFLCLPLSFIPLAYLFNTGQLSHWIYWLSFGFLCCFLVINFRLPILCWIAPGVRLSLSHGFLFRGTRLNFACYWWCECNPFSYDVMPFLHYTLFFLLYLSF